MQRNAFSLLLVPQTDPRSYMAISKKETELCRTIKELRAINEDLYTRLHNSRRRTERGEVLSFTTSTDVCLAIRVLRYAGMKLDIRSKDGRIYVTAFDDKSA